MLIEVLDTTLLGEIKNSFKIDLEENTSPEKVIMERVTLEVIAHNKKDDENLNSLVQPVSREDVLNGTKRKDEVDAEKQVYLALEAFKKNVFFILVDDKQVTELNQKITLKKDSKISFIKLTPLVGG
ncbi:hypothetical protein [Tenacibaculum sp. nBUS_03]|uniref:hypothetical protein n=1 Tax=Tenacibaculum sp. nBUS_03 TaxID=3395320 RepID=UPI003EBA96F0